MSVRLNGKEYGATVTGLVNDYSWDGRESKTIEFFKGEITYAECATRFVDGAQWEIVEEQISSDENGNPITVTEVFSNSEFLLAGDIVDHRDGRISVKMGKLSDLEQLIEDIYGGVL